jgi:hypothetical protein
MRWWVRNDNMTGYTELRSGNNHIDNHTIFDQCASRCIFRYLNILAHRFLLREHERATTGEGMDRVATNLRDGAAGRLRSAWIGNNDLTTATI